jgi:hypothetical protein
MPMVGFEPVPAEDVLVSMPSTLTTTPTTVLFVVHFKKETGPVTAYIILEMQPL